MTFSQIQSMIPAWGTESLIQQTGRGCWDQLNIVMNVEKIVFSYFYWKYIEVKLQGVLEETLTDLDEVLDEWSIIHPVGPSYSCFLFWVLLPCQSLVEIQFQARVSERRH